VFVTFEGIEGAGKSSLIALLAATLRDRVTRLVVTREPGGTPLGDAVRAVFVDRRSEIAPLAEVFLLNASRAQLVEDVIAPAVREGATVLCDRFFDATVAYQGFGRGLDVDMLLDLALVATNRIAPDITFLLDVTVEVSRRRVAARVAESGVPIDRLEHEDDAFHERVRTGYHALAERFGRYVVLDAARPLADLAADALAAIEHRGRAPG